MSAKDMSLDGNGHMMFFYVIAFDMTNAYALATKAIPTSSQSKAAFIEWMEKRLDLYRDFLGLRITTGWGGGGAVKVCNTVKTPPHSKYEKS